ncbi:hypothetical protein H2200_004989 [Cladophialophora chaetospira]|uniref:BTB domain-containing protein n=1 Tax=Cladophialophora chaetospira TaxID=386627 RepID=A0AA38XB96_9EURO|nr:hypothetical protein H2200_004989 [Cladophialophora chaetospira]
MTPPTGTKRKADDMYSPEEIPRKASLLVMVDDGDVLLKAGEGEDAYDFKVSGHVLSQASKVFNDILTSQGQAQTKVIEMYEHEPHIVEVCCGILHHKATDDYLENLDAEDLVQLLEMAEKWHCLHALKPWLATRISGASDPSENKNWLCYAKQCIEEEGGVRLKSRCNYLGRDLWFRPKTLVEVAGNLGLRDLFWKATKLCLITPLEACDETVAYSIKPVTFYDSGLTHDNVNKVISSYRRKHVQKYLKDLFDCLDKYSNKTTDAAQDNQNDPSLFREAIRELEKMGITKQLIESYPACVATAMAAVLKVNDRLVNMQKETC